MNSQDILRWLKSRFFGILDGIIAAVVVGGGAYLVGTYAGMLPEFNVTWPFTIPLTVVVIGILVFVGTLTVSIRLRKNAARFIKPFRYEHRPSHPLDLERLGLSQYMEPDPGMVDRTHKFSLIRQRYIIDGYDGEFELEYRGENATKGVSRSYRDAVVGDSPLDVPIMAIEAEDKYAGVPLKWDVLKDEPYKKLIEIFFARPLNSGDNFFIKLRFQWPGAFTRTEDYVFFPTNHYKLGVDKIIGELVLKKAPSYVEGIRFDGKKFTLEPTQPRVIKKKRKVFIIWEIKNPKYMYILQYGRRDI